jgi:hypothetical protein
MGRPSTSVSRTCDLVGCRKVFFVKRSKIAIGAGRFCSVRCRQTATRLDASTVSIPIPLDIRPAVPPSPKVAIRCQSCGEDFLVFPSRASGRRVAKFCSRACWSTPNVADTRWIERRCENCGRNFSVRASSENPEKLRVIRRHCSAVCHAEHKFNLKWSRGA